MHLTDGLKKISLAEDMFYPHLSFIGKGFISAPGVGGSLYSTKGTIMSVLYTKEISTSV